MRPEEAALRNASSMSAMQATIVRSGNASSTPGGAMSILLAA